MEAVAPNPLPDPASLYTPPSSAELRRRDWVTRYVEEWQQLAVGRVDVEFAHMDGTTLYYLLSHRPPEEIARQHFARCTGADDFTCRVEEKYQSLAVEVGLVPPGAPLTREHLDFAYGVANLCAVVVDRFRDSRDGSAGDHIRANYGPVPF